eukprot:TRINITY_DN1410_c0_g1_i2.p1 TRINITY_DN1410_c0_g1~~TRINITY_DN1410_c0_g1_i2.p1  ORF type:complete len:276 (+),score=67.29 TRINITY_DN1410_c0_g1_i2:93-830(+)
MPRTPGTPMVEPRTPGGAGMIAEPRTPAADGGYGTEAGTPYEAVATPGLYNDVPATPGDGFAGEQESGTAEFDALVDVEVTVILNNSPSDTRPARVVSVRPDGAMYTVAWLDGVDKGAEVDIGYQELMIVSAQCEPEQDGQAGERVKVIRGEHLGKRAAVVSADERGRRCCGWRTTKTLSWCPAPTSQSSPSIDDKTCVAGPGGDRRARVCMSGAASAGCAGWGVGIFPRLLQLRGPKLSLLLFF